MGRRIEIRCTDKEIERWQVESERRGLTLSAWARLTLNGGVSPLPENLPGVVRTSASPEPGRVEVNPATIPKVNLEHRWDIHLAKVS